MTTAISHEHGNKKVTVTRREDGSIYIQIKDEDNFAYLEDYEMAWILKQIKGLSKS